MRRLRYKLSRWFSQKFDSARAWFDKYEQRISSIALISGFIFDYLTLTRIDRLYDNLVIVFYLFVAAGSITFIHLYESWTFHKYIRAGGKLDTLCGWVHLALPTILQFAFGGLFSAFVVFYSRSATLAGSWPFMLLLVALLIGNEFFRRRYIRLSFQVSILFFAVYSYSIFAVPIIVGSISWWVFLLSGIVTLLLIIGFLYFLSKVIPTRFRQSKRSILISVSGIFIVINFLYFTNIIPPIPLSLQDAGVYHLVSRDDGGDYIAQREPLQWYEYLRPTTVLHVVEGDTVYAFSSIFAPSDLRTDIVHVWQYYDIKQERWVTVSKIQFPVLGGRESGFRGYSYKSNIFGGDWRVTITTPDGRIVGRIKFEIKEVDQSPQLEEIKL